MQAWRMLGAMSFVLVMLAGMAFAGNYDVSQNGTATQVNIENQPPEISEPVVLDDFDTVNGAEGNEIMDLEPNTTKSIQCRGEVYDVDGSGDIANVQGTLWHTGSTTQASGDDPTNHYTDTSCATSSVSGTNLSFNCTADVQFYAQPGEWRCNVSINDSESHTVTTEDNASMNQLLAVEINQTVVDFGSLGIGQNATDSVDYQNQGNVDFQPEIDAWAANTTASPLEGANNVMNCSSGMIDAGYMASGDSSTTSYGTMQTNGDDMTGQWNLYSQTLGSATSGSTPTGDLLNLGLEIPTGVSGSCEGVVGIQVSSI